MAENNRNQAKLVRNNDGYHFKFSNGTRTIDFSWARDFIFFGGRNFAIVRDKETGTYHAMNVNGEIAEMPFTHPECIYDHMAATVEFNFTKSVIEPSIERVPDVKKEVIDGKEYFYYDFQDGVDRQRFVSASEFEVYFGENLAIVKPDEKSPYQMINLFGELSDQKFRDIRDISRQYAKGLGCTFNAPQRIITDKGVYFVFPNGEETRRFYEAGDFINYYGIIYAWVQKEYPSKIQAMNLNGQLSKEGFWKVRKLDDQILSDKGFTYEESAIERKEEKGRKPADNKQNEAQNFEAKVQEPVKFIPQRKEAKEAFRGKDKVYYDFQDGSVFQFFDYASEFGTYDGVLLATVQSPEKSQYQMINIFGELSDQKFSNLSLLQAFTNSGEQFTFNGKEISPKLRFRNGKAYFLFPDGTRTKEFSKALECEWTREFFAVVQNIPNGAWRVLNGRGELSSESFDNKPYNRIAKNDLTFSKSALEMQDENGGKQMEKKENNAKDYAFDLEKYKVVNDEKGFHFVLPNGAKTRNFYYANKFQKYWGQVFAIVQRSYTSPTQAMNIDGQLSERGFPNGRSIIEFVDNGGVLTFKESALKNQAQSEEKQMENKEIECQIIQGYRYQLPNGKVTEKFFWGTQFSDYLGVLFAIVQKDASSKFQAMNHEGELSNETFDNMSVMYQHIQDGGTFTYGKGAEKSGKADKSLEIYSMSKPGPDFASMQRLYKYFGYEVTIYDLTPEEVLENFDKIQAFEDYNYHMALTQCDYGQEMEELYQNYLAVTEYIKQTAYEAMVKLENSRKLQEKRAEYAEKPLF